MSEALRQPPTSLVGVIDQMISLWNPCFWWLRFWRNYERQIRDMNIRQARERAALTAWQIEVEHAMREREDERRHWYAGNNAE